MRAAVKEKAVLFAELAKLRLSSLVATSSLFGYAFGAPVAFDLPYVATATCVTVGTLLCSASANTINQWWEVRTDGLMHRTKARPLPSGRITPQGALCVAAGSGMAGTALLLAGTNPVVAALGLGNIVLYGFVYTPLKQLSQYNTDIGAVVGAVPPVMGYVAAAGGLTAATGMTALLSPESALVGALLFAWQMPHFHALSWTYRADYQSGGHAMASVLDPSGDRTARLMVGYSALLTALPFVATYAGMLHPYGALVALPANGKLLWDSVQFYGKRSNANAKAAFHTSLWHILVLMGAFVVWSKCREEPKEETDEDLKCSIKSTGMKALCMHEALRDVAVTPTCTEVAQVADNVTDKVVGAAVLASPAVAAQAAVDK